MNTNKIAQAFEENREKFKHIEKITNETGELQSQKVSNYHEILKIYSLIFRNFSPRIATNVFIKDQYGNGEEEIILNKDGIYLKSNNHYSVNARALTFMQLNSIFKSLAEIRKAQDKILPCIPKESKRELFLNFLNILEPIENMTDVNLEIKIPPQQIVTDLSSLHIAEKENIVGLTMERASDVKMDSESGNYTNTSLTNTSLSDMLKIEQLYDEIVEISMKYQEAEKQQLKLSQEVLKNMTEKFSDFLILDNLREKNETEQ